MDDVAKALKGFRQEMRDMKVSIVKELREECNELKKSVEFMSKQFDAMSERCKNIDKENAELKKANAALSAECDVLKQQARHFENRVTDLEQYSRNKNIEIKGLTETEHEKLPEMIKKLGDVVNVPIAEEDMEVCHRVPRKVGECPNVVVQFTTRTKRDAVLEAARKRRVNTADFGLNGRSPVYINEHLCLSVKRLLGQVTARKNEKHWKYAWTKQGKIFARKTDESRVLRVRCADDLEKIE